MVKGTGEESSQVVLAFFDAGKSGSSSLGAVLLQRGMDDLCRLKVPLEQAYTELAKRSKGMR